MTNNDIELKVSEIRELEEKIDEYKAQIEALKDILKAEFDGRKVDKIDTDLFHLSYVPVYKNTFDSAKFKKDNPEEYFKYARETSYLRFAILNRK